MSTRGLATQHFPKYDYTSFRNGEAKNTFTVCKLGTEVLSEAPHLLMRKELMGSHCIGAECPKAMSEPVPDTEKHKLLQKKKKFFFFLLNLIHSEVKAKREQYDSLVQNVLFSGFISANEEQVCGTRGNAVLSSDPAHPAQVRPQHLVFCTVPAWGCTLHLTNKAQMNGYPQNEPRKVRNA